MKKPLPKYTASIVYIPINSLKLEGELVLPARAKGLVVFAHGSGSSRLSPRNIFVARRLNQDGLATLLVDLLSEKEDLDYQKRFDIQLLTQRLVNITAWATRYNQTKNLTIGYFGASNGAAAAMLAAEKIKNTIRALVSRGGRVDLAAQVASRLKPATLFIVGSKDWGVREVNEEVYSKLKCSKKLSIVEGATHLFEEPGALTHVAELASKWFKKYLLS